MDLQILETIGLLKNDRKVYLSLLEIGSTTISQLVKKTSLHRSYVYDLLDKLIDLGLVSFTIRNNKKFFTAENPQVILKLFDTKEQKIEEDRKKLENILPQLQQRKILALKKQEAKIFVGKEGIKSILEDILFERQDFIGFGAEGKFKNIYQWYFSNWQKRRVKAKIRYKIIYNTKMRGKRPLKDQKLVEIRFLPGKYEFPATTLVYGDKVAILLWNNSPIGFVLESKEVVRSFISYFEVLWSVAKI